MDSHVNAASVLACYARYSNEELQRSSIADQVRQCKKSCQMKGWILDEEFIRADEGLSGASIQSRPALKSLLREIERGPSRINGVIMDSTSRLGRSLADVMSVVRLLKFFGVFLYFVAQNLDSRDPGFYHAIIAHAQGDEVFLDNLSSAVKRGQGFRVVDGMIHGGRYYGYISEVIPDPTRRGTVTRPAIKGVKLTFEPTEIAAARRVWDWALEGMSYLSIARKAEEEQLPRWRPNTPWTISFVQGILHQETYRGRFVYGRTRSVRDPRNGRVIHRPRPEHEWSIDQRPNLAIVTDEEWKRVHALIAAHKSFGLSRLGGMARATSSEPLLLSGKLICGQCNGRIVVTGKAHNGDRTYGCKTHRYQSSPSRRCTNRLVVHCSVIETAVIQHITSSVLRPDMLEFAVRRFYDNLKEKSAKERLLLQRKQASLVKLRKERKRLNNEMRHIIDSLKLVGASPVLLSELKRMEDRLRMVDNELHVPAGALREVSVEEIRQFVQESAGRLSDLLLAKGRIAARDAIIMHLGDLVLHPEIRNGLPTYRVTGSLRLSDGEGSSQEESRYWHGQPNSVLEVIS